MKKIKQFSIKPEIYLGFFVEVGYLDLKREQILLVYARSVFNRGENEMQYTGLIAIAALAGAAHAGFFSETESNNTLSTANYIGQFDAPGGSLLVDGAIITGDVDWFSFSLSDTASLSFFAGFATDGADGIMQIVTDRVGDTGNVIAFDDDSGVGLMPAIQIENLAAGTYYIGLSGFGDVGSGSVDSDEIADGGQHSQNFGYKLSIGFSIVPAPGSLALLGLGGMAMTRRRR